MIQLTDQCSHLLPRGRGLLDAIPHPIGVQEAPKECLPWRNGGDTSGLVPSLLNPCVGEEGRRKILELHDLINQTADLSFSVMAKVPYGLLAVEVNG
jgi:hypothetical protein